MTTRNSNSQPAGPEETTLGRTETDNRRAAIGLFTALLLTLGLTATRTGCDVLDLTADRRLDVSLQIDVNTATRDELLLLPGVGPILAERIIESRRRDGPFSCHEDLRRVRGIGPKTLEKSRPLLVHQPRRANKKDASPLR